MEMVSVNDGMCFRFKRLDQQENRDTVCVMIDGTSERVNQQTCAEHGAA